MNIYFSDYFRVTDEDLEEHGAFNISLVTDLPLFIDPFLLFNSPKAEYQALHDNIIHYLRFLRAKSENANVTPELLKAWYYFSEVKQNWLGFCKTSNTGRGLGGGFAAALDENLVLVFEDFGKEKITRGSHLEKLCLIRSGVGRDMISDFTTNLIKSYLLEYTSEFARTKVAPELLAEYSVSRVEFSYEIERWMPKKFVLPTFKNDYVILTPKEILTKDDTWINHSDMRNRFRDIPNAVENQQLRAEIDNYFTSKIPGDKEPTTEELDRAVEATLKKYPALMDYYIKMKEDSGEQAVAASKLKVSESLQLYVRQFGKLAELLSTHTDFYSVPGTTEDETRQKIEYFKDIVENKGGHKLFYGADGRPIRKETDVHIMFRLVWFGTPSDVSREVDDGRGPADFKISRGAADKTLVEFKLAANSQLKRNLNRQLELYKKASDAQIGFKVIVYFTEAELLKVEGVLRELKLEDDRYVILVDARSDNKPSASKA